jgi:ligand-binding sensor domain-containing protein
MTFTRKNSGLPNDRVVALAPGADGALWIGTEGGLARLDKDGRWQTYSTAGSGLPDDRVWALAPDADGALWIGTWGGSGAARQGRALANLQHGWQRPAGR